MKQFIHHDLIKNAVKDNFHSRRKLSLLRKNKYGQHQRECDAIIELEKNENVFPLYRIAHMVRKIPQQKRKSHIICSTLRM